MAVEKIGSAKIIKALSFWHGVTATALRKLPVDLSARQTAILLHVYLKPGPHSVKNLAEALDISKPAICRALDVLEEARLARRIRNNLDARGVYVERTAKGMSYLSDFAGIILHTSKKAA